jgi:hypothetical protein
VARLENPVKGDWILQAKKDLDEVNVAVDMEEIKNMSQENFKQKVKAAVNKAAFNYLSVEKARLSKIRDIPHEDLELQGICLEWFLKFLKQSFSSS